jgi:hypothetical protein
MDAGVPEHLRSSRVCIVTSAEPTPAQRAAWKRLWALLLADGPEHGNGPRGGREPLSDGPDPLARRTLGKPTSDETS